MSRESFEQENTFSLPSAPDDNVGGKWKGGKILWRGKKLLQLEINLKRLSFNSV